MRLRVSGVANDMSKQLDPAIVVPQAKQAILSLLEAAERSSGVSSVVLTISSFAVKMPKRGVSSLLMLLRGTKRPLIRHGIHLLVNVERIQGSGR